MTGFLQRLRQQIWGAPPTPVRPLPPSEPEPDEIAVPEISVHELQQRLQHGQPLCLLDVREPYEWRQVHIPTALHIPMNEIPQRLAELPTDQALVVFCAHGSRSYGVAGYLIEQGYQASSLAGGISQLVQAGVTFSQNYPEQ